MSSNDLRTLALASHSDEEDIRDIHPVSPPRRILPSSTPSTVSSDGAENFSALSREFNALVVAGAAMGGNNLHRIGEEGEMGMIMETQQRSGEAAVELVKKEEIEGQIKAWEISKVAKINNRFRYKDAIIKGWEDEQIDRATSRMKKLQRKLEEKRAKAEERMENEIAKAHRKAEEKRASAEAKRGTQVAKVVEKATTMRALGISPVKRSFF